MKFILRFFAVFVALGFFLAALGGWMQLCDWLGPWLAGPTWGRWVSTALFASPVTAMFAYMWSDLTEP